MRLTTIALIVTLALLVVPLAAEAQQTGKVWRIAFLGDGSAAMRAAHSLEPLRDGLRELGYVEGQNLIVEVRWTDGQPARLPELAAELVRLQVDVIVTHGFPAAHAVKTATTTIPIIVAVAADMVGTGLVASLRRPGGNVTGISDPVTEVSGKKCSCCRRCCQGSRRSQCSGIGSIRERCGPRKRHRQQPVLWACKGKVSFPHIFSRRVIPPACIDVVYIFRYDWRHGRAFCVARHHLYLGRRQGSSQSA
jgi:hypothetical protein